MKDQVVCHLATGWTLAFRLPTQSWGPTARDWLRSAAHDRANRSVLLDVLVAGARQRADVFSTLYGIAHRDEFRDEICGPLLDKINVAQDASRA